MFSLMAKALLIICNCGRRYEQTATRQPQPEQAFELCRCGQMLGKWDGHDRLHFEPEMDED
jgi:hypothetical protein